jgi:type I restriction enzyme S subunit
MEEWKKYKLGEVAIPVRDRIETSCLDSSSYISTENMLPNKAGVTLSSGIPSGNAIKFKNGDVLISNIRPYFKKIWRADKVGGCSADVICLRASNKVDPLFLYYLLSQDLFFDYVMQGAKGTKMPRGDKSLIMQWQISIPNINHQNKIASLLFPLDEKIKVNRRINDNLEQQAQTLFKSWFIDYEPFKKDGFEKSEAGLIPKGWRVGCYNDIIKETISGDWGKETSEGNYTHKVACIRGCDFQDIKNGLRGKTPERYILEKNYQNKHFCDKDMLVEISGGTATVSTGRVCPVSQLLIDKFDGNIVCTNFCRVVRPIAGYGAFLYYSWLYKYNNKVMFGYENGTSGIKNFRIKDFTALEPVVIPPKEVISQFQHLVDTILMQMQTYGTQNQCLAELRDTLLPHLMSGELKVNEIENSL